MPKVVKRSQPRGAKGTNLSIAEVVKRIEAGRMDLKTVAWTRETLSNAGLMGFGADKMAQAKAILARLRKDRPYVEDPVEGEFIPSAACTLKGCDGLIFLGEDCDGLVVAFLSAVESVGIEGAVVVHSYDASRQHTHVLAAVRDESRRVWVRCDPSTDDPFGVATAPTRETFYAVPGGHILTDSHSGAADASSIPSGLGRRPEGDFVGVGSPWGRLAKPKAVPGATGMTEAFRQAMLSNVERITRQLQDDWMAVVKAYAWTYAHAEAVGDPLPPVRQLPREHDLVRAKEIIDWAPQLIHYGEQVLNDERGVFPNDGGNDYIFTGSEGEFVIDFDEDKKLVVTRAEAALPEKRVGVGLHPGIIIGGIVVAVVCVGATYLTAQSVCDTASKWLDARRVQASQSFLERQTQYFTEQGMSPQDAAATAQRMQGQVMIESEQVAKSEVEKAKHSQLAYLSETSSSLLSTLAWVALGGAAIYGLTMWSGVLGPVKGFGKGKATA